MEAYPPEYNLFSFNYLKHHLQFAIAYCKEQKLSLGEEMEIKRFASSLINTGNNITDIYIGKLSIYKIMDEITFKLEEEKSYILKNFVKLFISQDYHQIEISDGSIWIIRKGKNYPAYIHIHPARIGKNTMRLVANAWKTALLCNYFRIHDPGFEFEPGMVNMLRTNYLDLPPIKKLRLDDNISLAYKLLSE